MDYVPREGVDYIVDLYQVTGVPSDIDPDNVKHAINNRLLEYHPDRLQGLAPEFQRKGELMARLLNRAKIVLLDDEKRSEYDQILTAWEGPVSRDGTPVIRMDDALRAEAAGQSPEELEAAFSRQSVEVTAMVKHNPKQQAMLGRLLEASDGENTDELRDAYDAALFAEDQVLAIEEAERGRLLGLKGNKRYETSLGYSDNVQVAIEGARAAQTEDYHRRALGGVGAQLALLAGESPGPNQGSILPAAGALPPYFDEQAKKVSDLAVKREALLEKRLEIFQPTYPNVELQTEAQPNFAVGITKGSDSVTTWVGFNFDPEAFVLENIAIDEGVETLLNDRKYEEVYANGYNILTFAPKDQIELKTLLEEACNKHVGKYYPELFE